MFERLVLWEPSLSPHKADLLAALAAQAPEIEIICCANNDLSPDRRSLGWAVPRENGYKNIISPSQDEIERIFSESSAETIHIFSGMRWVPNIVDGLRMAKKTGAHYAIMSEPRVAEGFSGKIRLLQSWLTEGYHRKNAAFILAIGSNGPSWFRMAGYPPAKIIPFAYFVSPPKVKPYHPSETGQLRIGYLGRIVRMKGVFELAEAVSKLGKNYSLSIAGHGEDEASLKKYLHDQNISHEFHGVLPRENIGEFFSQIDVLVLASNSKDGWGVVISEALMSGVPVVASSMVGASMILNHAIFGRKINPGSSGYIISAISELQKNGILHPNQRQQRAVEACKYLSDRNGAASMLSAISWSSGKSERPSYFYEKAE